jgi:arylformamidase
MSDISNYESWDRAVLDREYSPSSCLSGPLDPYLEEYAVRSRNARRRLTGELDLHYGPHPDETLDLFRPAKRGVPLLVFFHGGYWQMLSKDDFSYLAPALLAHGSAFASVNYSLMPQTGIEEIVAQSCRAVSWLDQHSRNLGIDGDRIFVAGHSAGAHLAAMCLPISRRRADAPESVSCVRGACLISGIFDLEPLRYTSENAIFRLTKSVAVRNSPINHLPTEQQTVVACYAENETREFQLQSSRYADACRACGVDCQLLELSGANHFDVVSQLAEQNSPLFRMVLQQMGLPESSEAGA